MGHLEDRQTVTVKIKPDSVDTFLKKYDQFKTPVTGDYVLMHSVLEDMSVILYKSKKGYKAVFEGLAPQTLEEAKLWEEQPSFTPVKVYRNDSEDERWECYEDQMGSDECGVADFLMPMVACATYVTKDHINFLKTLGVNDSKKVSDAKIRELVPLIKDRIYYATMILSNDRYNALIAKGENMNSIKTKMHNRVLSLVKGRFPAVKYVFIDQFTEPRRYFKYLIFVPNALHGVTFKTKGETYYPCVAVASMIARYVFLELRDKISKEIGEEVVLGNGPKANEQAKRILEKYGKEKFDDMVKKNFANYDKVLNS